MSGVTAESTLLLHFTSRRPDGEIFEDTRSGKPVLVTLGKKQINPAFEEALIGKSEGETIKRHKLSLDHEPVAGEIIRVEVLKKPCLVTVVGVTDKSITVDANHPLAGETITYDITIEKIF